MRSDLKLLSVSCLQWRDEKLHPNWFVHSPEADTEPNAICAKFKRQGERKFNHIEQQLSWSKLSKWTSWSSSSSPSPSSLSNSSLIQYLTLSQNRKHCSLLQRNMKLKNVCFFFSLLHELHVKWKIKFKLKNKCRTIKAKDRKQKKKINCDVC